MKPTSISAEALFEEHRPALHWEWVAGHAHPERHFDEAAVRDARSAADLVGYLNYIHPYRVQIVGRREVAYLSDAAGEETRTAHLAHRHARAAGADRGRRAGAAGPAGGDVRPRGDPAVRHQRSAGHVIDVVRAYLGQLFAERTTRHGVFMDILGLGVLLTGESGLGKSELGLELISRGHGLVADDAVDLYRVSQTSLEGRCPELLLNLLEVRGIGLLDIKAIFGETAVRRKMRLKLIVHLVRKETMEREFERLPYEPLYEEILGVPVRKAVIAVDAGRNLAVLVEAAVRNTVLQLRGIDTYNEFIQRHQRAMEARPLGDEPEPVRPSASAGAGSPSWCTPRRAPARGPAARSPGSAPRALALLDLGVVELLDAAAGQAHQVVVMLAFVQLEHRLAGLEVAAREQAGLLELHQHAVDRGQADVGALGQQRLEDVLGRHVALRGALEDLQDLQARQRRLEAAALEFVGVCHGRSGGRVAPIESLHHTSVPAAEGSRRDTPCRRPSHPDAVRRLRLLLAAAAGGWPAASRCRSSDSFLGVITPYRIDIVQGNVITKEQAAMVKPGMTRVQVRDMLGSPLLTELFHADRWDYVFTIRRQGTQPQRRSVVAQFNGDALERLEAAGRFPSESEFVASIATYRAGHRAGWR